MMATVRTTASASLLSAGLYIWATGRETVLLVVLGFLASCGTSS